MSFFNHSHNNRGDTIVEVMLSMAVIGMVIGGAYTISNKSTQLGRLAQQRTQVNNLMRSQAELLKLFRDNDTHSTTDAWSTVMSYVTGTTDAQTKPTKPVNCSTSIGDRNETNNVFYIKSDNSIAKYDPGTPDKGGDPTGQYQIWVEPYRSGAGYTDFYIIGCWQGPGSYGQQQSFIVERLNDPS